LRNIRHVMIKENYSAKGFCIRNTLENKV